MPWGCPSALIGACNRCGCTCWTMYSFSPVLNDASTAFWVICPFCPQTLQDNSIDIFNEKFRILDAHQICLDSKRITCTALLCPLCTPNGDLEGPEQSAKPSSMPRQSHCKNVQQHCCPLALLSLWLVSSRVWFALGTNLSAVAELWIVPPLLQCPAIPPHMLCVKINDS